MRPSSPRTGRRAGSSGTREAILSSARHLFADRGYEGASLRAIGAHAGVDAALVIHFFGTKAKLLSASVRWPFDPDAELARMLADGPERTGESLARLFVSTWDELGERNPIITLLRSATTEPAAAAITREFLTTRLLGPLLRQLASDSADLRADLIASQLIGLGIARHVFRLDPLANTSAELVVACAGPTLQRYLTGALPVREDPDL
jgi:AcrR family transcriptional regulator